MFGLRAHGATGACSEESQHDGEGQGSLACCSLQGHKELDTTEQLNNITSCRSEWPPSKNLQRIHAGEDVEKMKQSYTAGGTVN